jgi:hypothetical protein
LLSSDHDLAHLNNYHIKGRSLYYIEPGVSSA